MNKLLFLFGIIIIEGYVVLSAELLAIRQTLPYIGSGTDTVSIIIAAVLMPLAFGYYMGGKFKPGWRNGQYQTIRKKLILNIFISLIILFFGLSYIMLSIFFVSMIQYGINDRLILTTIYAATFLVVPVYLLGQTIPLISNYFSKTSLAKTTGRILFFSTFGSFLGAILSTLVLMPTIGVHNTAAITLALLVFLIILLSKKKSSDLPIIALVILGISFYINSGAMMKSLNIVENNQYNTITVMEEDNVRSLYLNNNNSSSYDDEGNKHAYIEFMESVTIAPIQTAPLPKNILVIGAGAFTFGLEDTNNHYDFIDIDGSLKEIAEEKILKQKLGDNKIFHPIPIRAYLTKTKIKYDVIIIDVFKSGFAIPEHLVTQEFFKTVKDHLNEGGLVLGNFNNSPNFLDTFSRTLDNTLRSVFPHISRHIVNNDYDLWNNDKSKAINAIYLYRHIPGAKSKTIYTDDKNRSFLDRERQMPIEQEETEKPLTPETPRQ